MKSCLKKRWLSLLAVVVVGLAVVSSAQAEDLAFTISPNQTLSILSVDDGQGGLESSFRMRTWLGASLDNNPHVVLEPQGTGAETAVQTGTINVSVDDAHNPTGLMFIGGVNKISMENSGSWLPAVGGGSAENPGTAAPGVFGYQYLWDGEDTDPQHQVNFYVTTRNAEYELRMMDGESADPIPVTGGSFPWDDANSRVRVDHTGGAWHVNQDDLTTGGTNGGDVAGSFSIDGAEHVNFYQDFIDDTWQATPVNGTYSVTGNTATLTVPIHVTFGFENPQGTTDDVYFTYVGTIQATAELSSSLQADFDEDGDVDGADFLLWQRGFGDTYTATDLANWQDEFGQAGGSATANLGAVPEPGSVVLLSMACMACLGWRRRPFHRDGTC